MFCSNIAKVYYRFIFLIFNNNLLLDTLVNRVLEIKEGDEKLNFFPPIEILKIVYSIAKGLAIIHDHGYTHRDIKVHVYQK